MTEKKIIKNLKDAYVFYSEVEEKNGILVNKNAKILDTIEKLLTLIENESEY